MIQRTVLYYTLVPLKIQYRMTYKNIPNLFGSSFIMLYVLMTVTILNVLSPTRLLIYILSYCYASLDIYTFTCAVAIHIQKLCQIRV